MSKATIIAAVFAVCALLAASLAFALGSLARSGAQPPTTTVISGPPTEQDTVAAIQINAVESIRIDSNDGEYTCVPVVQFANTGQHGVKLEEGSFEITIHARKGKKEEAEPVKLGTAAFHSLELPPTTLGGGHNTARLELRIPAGARDEATVARLFRATNIFSDPSYEVTVEMKGSADVWGWTKSGENVEGWVNIGPRKVHLFFKPTMRNSALLK